MLAKLVAISIVICLGCCLGHYMAIIAIYWYNRIKKPSKVTELTRQEMIEIIQDLYKAIDSSIEEIEEQDKLNAVINEALSRDITEIIKRYSAENVITVYWKITSYMLKSYFGQKEPDTNEHN